MLLRKVIPYRYSTWLISGLLFVGGLFFCWFDPVAGAPIAVIFGALSVIGALDYFQKKQAIRRNYPIIGHFRFFFEFIRPEIRQYFMESDTEEIPFSRAQRSLVYQRAKNVVDQRPYGTLTNVYESHYEWVNHAINTVRITDHDFRVMIGEHNAKQPYSLSLYNISAMSFGALSGNAIMALNKGARAWRLCARHRRRQHQQYHRVHGGDLIWEIGSGYFGCRNEDGTFSAERFAKMP